MGQTGDNQQKTMGIFAEYEYLSIDLGVGKGVYSIVHCGRVPSAEKESIKL